MNALGFSLLGSITHATAFAVVGIAAYLAIRRWGPAVGSLAAGSSLCIMALVSIVALGPWPRWWTLAADRPSSPVSLPAPAAAAAAERAVTAGGNAEGPQAAPPALPRSAIAAPAVERPDFLAHLIDELRRPSVGQGRAAWSWRGWLATGFLAAMGLGVVRLLLGLWGIARLRARGRPVDDAELVELLHVLRAELSVTRDVELRELVDLTTPATVGWRRPVLLLPIDWREWDAEERRAVVAHELAHVRRGDFAAGVAAQLAVALHFYHPLSHWLANRLRLEQELAADAWGARLSGGTSSYLSTLARMSLRRDGGALTWPARAFLPSHGTFVRRIEMLKDHGPIGSITVSPLARVATVALLLSLGLLIAGLRGPAGESPAFAGAQAQARPAAKAADGRPGVHDVTFVPADACMIVSLRPGTVVARREFRTLVDLLRLDLSRRARALSDRFPIPPEEIEQALVFWESAAGTASGPAGRPTFAPPPSGFVVRTTTQQDWAALVKKLAPRAEEAHHDGQTYLRITSGGPIDWAVYATADKRTLVVAEDVVLRDLIADRNATAPRHPWDDAWNKLPEGQARIAIDARWLRRQIARSRAVPPHAAVLALDTFSPLYEKAESYAAGIVSTDRSVAIDLVAVAGSPEKAGEVAETLQAVLTLTRNTVRGLRRDTDGPGPNSEARDWLLEAADSLVAQTKVETSQAFVRVHGESSVDLAEGVRLLVPAVKSAQVAAHRTESVLNLKRIGLAFFNYNSVAHHFPASINQDKGGFPYSWRVAILPYLEGHEYLELYGQYHFDEPWDGPNNRKLLDRMPRIYAYPAHDGSPTSQSHTSYFLPAGPSTIGGVVGGARIEQITDGTSNTILAVEAIREIPWTKPEDIPFDPKAPPPEMGGFTPDGFNAVFADGSVHFLKNTINPSVLKALMTQDGGEVVSVDQY